MGIWDIVASRDMFEVATTVTVYRDSGADSPTKGNLRVEFSTRDGDTPLMSMGEWEQFKFNVDFFISECRAKE